MTRALGFLLSLVVVLTSGATVVWAQPVREKSTELRKFNNFGVRVRPHWRLSNQTHDSLQIYVPLKKDRPARPSDDSGSFVATSEAGMGIAIERRRTHAEALQRLAEIASEYEERATLRIIAGWPAIERRYRAPLPQRGQRHGQGSVDTLFATTAVAVAETVIRFDTMLAPDADPDLLDEAIAIGRSLSAPKGPTEVSKRELDEIRKMVKPPGRKQQQGPAPGNGTKPQPGGMKAPGIAVDVKAPGIAVQARPGLGELEVATNDGQHVVVATNSGYAYSDNFGASYTPLAPPACTQGVCNGDPTLAVGFSGAIYYGRIEGPSWSQAGNSIARSTNNGQSFTFQGMAATCPGTTSCQIADQPHIAADRKNPAMGGGDRIYNVWRDFYGPVQSIRISCSSDSGSTWTAGTQIASQVPHPRVTVGGDGSVYVAYWSGSNMMLQKYSNCDAGLLPQGGPITVATFTAVVCPVPGLNRCGIGMGPNTLSSPMVAVDDLDHSHIYYAFATSTGAGNEDVMVYDSVDGGASFTRSVRVNSAVPGRRFMPWLSVYGGIAVVSWYDRRTATTTSNSLTRFYMGGAAVRGPNLVALTETDISGVDDAQCSPWTSVFPRTQNDSESCIPQPQPAGRCSITTATRCDFSDAAMTTCPSGGSCCPAGQTCIIPTSDGGPKYGDYNGNTAWVGRFYSAWASGTPPASIGGSPGAIQVYASADRIPSDFYVRDWNQSPTLFDSGAQPSTQANFWSTSDVWNQNTSVPAAPAATGAVVGDPPSNLGPNFAFARVSRRAPAMSTAPDAPVAVNFLLGDFGLGAPFVPIGSQTVTFSAGDMTKVTPALSWSVPSASIHLCLAVQIEAPDGDTFATPSVAGTAPGPADPSILVDNNKAQRNLGETVGTGAGITELIAIIRNPELKTRVVGLRMKVPSSAKISGSVDVLGGTKSEITKITDDGRIAIGKLAPGETRWVRFRFETLGGLDIPTPIDVFEDTDPPANGFTILLRRSSLENVIRRNLFYFAGVLSRLAHIHNSASAKEQAEIALRASKEVSKAAYDGYLSANRKAIEQVITKHIGSAKGRDSFEVELAAKDLLRAIDQKDFALAAAAQTALTERLNAHLTMLSRAQGTTDEIVHNVQWQKALFTRVAQAPSSTEIVEASGRFLAEWRDPSAFPKLLDSTSAALDRASTWLGQKNAAAKTTYAALRREQRSGASAAKLQKLHRDFLIQVQKLGQ